NRLLYFIDTTLSYFDQLKVFSDYLHKTKLDDVLTNEYHITVFAPTNDAIKSQLKFHEREYLMGECVGALDDLDIWTKHHLHYDKVLYSDTFDVGDTNGLISFFFDNFYYFIKRKNII